MSFRKLKADETECRVANITDKGVMLLIYKDARVDMRLLDETYGVFGWQKSYETIDGRLYCTVSIKNPETGEWISKSDVGTESYTEKEKGQASDAFKRACFNWGIGRELYTAPFIWINKGDYTVDEKGRVFDKFNITDIGYDQDGKINKLIIYNEKLNREVFRYGVSNVQEKKTKKTDAYPAREEMLEVVKAHYPDGDILKALLDTFKINSLDEATDAQLQAVYNKYKGK